MQDLYLTKYIDFLIFTIQKIENICLNYFKIKNFKEFFITFSFLLKNEKTLYFL